MKVLLPYGPMLTKTKNIRKKSENDFVSKMKKTSGDMAKGKPQLKFERNPCNNFRDNRCHRRTDDGRRTNIDFMSSADIVKQT